jgi:protein gp37
MSVATAPVTSGTSAIEWTERTLNPWTGCTKVSPGCAHCYIAGQPPFRIAGRKFERGHIPLVFHMQRLRAVVRRRKPTLYFVNSLSDVFHEDASNHVIAQVWAAMALAPQHTFQVLTKRPERMRKLLNNEQFQRMVECEEIAFPGAPLIHMSRPWPLPNVWLGVTIENRRFVHRADLLRDTPAAVRYISAEPLLGPLVARFEPDGELGEWVWPDGKLDMDVGAGLDLSGIDWLIAGGESGPQHRQVRAEWVRDLRDACCAAGVAFFFKQWGGRTSKSGGRVLDGRTHDDLPAYGPQPTRSR